MDRFKYILSTFQIEEGVLNGTERRKNGARNSCFFANFAERGCLELFPFFNVSFGQTPNDTASSASPDKTNLRGGI